jgi:hypothetical protein
MSSGPRPQSWAAGRCHVLFLLLVQKKEIMSKPRFATNRVLVVSEDQKIDLYLIRGNPPPVPPPGTPGEVASGGYGSRAPERTALQVARVPGPQPLMSDCSAVRPSRRLQTRIVGITASPNEI